MNRICYDRILPRDLHRLRARTRLAIVKSKQWVNGSTLRVRFLSGTHEQRDTVVKFASVWTEYANIKFVFGDDPASEIRITFNDDGAWSYIGTDCLEIPRDQPTMNFGWLSPDVIYHEFGHCLDGDTLIDSPRDLDKYPMGIQIKDLVNKHPWVYCWKEGSLTIRRASRVWLSKRAETVKVVIRPSSGKRSKRYLPPQEIIGTADHPVLLSDGKTWKALGDLQPGDGLCSLYRLKSGYRSSLQWTGGPRQTQEHVFVCEHVYGVRPLRHDAHHINENKHDQTPENLRWKHESDHQRDHATGKKTSEETKVKLSVAHKQRYANGEVHPMLGKHLGEETKAKISNGLRGRPVSEATRRKIAETLRGHKVSEQTRAKITASAIDFYDNGGVHPMLGKHHSEESKRQMSRSAISRNHKVVSVEPAGIRDVYDMTVPGADSFIANGVVVHNSLGLIHEHSSPFGGIQWNREQVIKDLSGSPNFWDVPTIEANVFEKYSSDQVNGTEMDTASIMMYSFPASWTTNGLQVPENKVLSPNDKLFIGSAKGYPRLVAEKLLTPSFIVEKEAIIFPPGEEDLYLLKIVDGGQYTIQTQGSLDCVMSVFGPDSKTALIDSDDDSGLAYNSLVILDLKPGDYWVSVRHYSKLATGNYSISATRILRES